MRLLADECCDPRLVATLRGAGYDVLRVLEGDCDVDDEAILALCQALDRILITEDKDFGELAIRYGKPLPGLILLRFTPAHRHRKANVLSTLLADHGARLVGRCAVVDERRVRFRPLLV